RKQDRPGIDIQFHPAWAVLRWRAYFIDIYPTTMIDWMPCSAKRLQLQAWSIWKPIPNFGKACSGIFQSKRKLCCPRLQNGKEAGKPPLPNGCGRTIVQLS